MTVPYDADTDELIRLLRIAAENPQRFSPGALSHMLDGAAICLRNMMGAKPMPKAKPQSPGQLDLHGALAS